MNNRILNVGSFMMDLVFTANRRPSIGETLIGTSFGMFTGGKGYNQAVAAARLGAHVTMLGALGEDYFGNLFLDSLRNEGINIDRLTHFADLGTGVACPTIFTDERNNSIIIVPNANKHFNPSYIAENADVFSKTDLLMLQLEVPVETSFEAARRAHDAGIPVLLNPAPFKYIPDELFTLIDILIPNEVEAHQLSGINIVDRASAEVAARIIHDKGAKEVVITLGKDGAIFFSEEEVIYSPAFKVNVVDPTAAGDAFCASYAVAFLNRNSPKEALIRANAAGALATTVIGAEPSLPRNETLQRFLQQFSVH